MEQTDKDAASTAAPVSPFEFEEKTIAELQEAMRTGKHTARSITESYLARIQDVDKQGPALNSVIELNPDALAMAENLDNERKAGRVRGPLHGIPILIKDNIDTGDRMLTTAGSLALIGQPAPRDAYIIEKLRESGAVVLGKTNLSEWANIRSTNSTSGWSGRGGLTRNPFALDRNPSGSSAGSGAAASANLCAAAIGTETDGSIISPAAACGLVGIKPTVGLLSRSGIIPISHSQDTPGPMARTVADAAVLLGALIGIDPRDPVTNGSRGKDVADYTRFFNPDALRGARIGVARNYFGYSEAVDKMMAAAIDAMKQAGAIVIDPADVPTASQLGPAEKIVLLFELKDGLNRYLAERAMKDGPRTLAEVIRFNEANRATEMPYFGQDRFVDAETKGPLTTKVYLEALAKNHKLARAQGIDAVTKKWKLDAFIAPSRTPAWLTDLVNGDSSSHSCSGLPAVAGYPHITLPMGYVHGLPVGISFFGPAWSEAKLISLAYAFEQLTKFRRAPKFLRTAELNS
ncbi:MAG TPA: amidase [Chthoniobacterales bacterium]|nr:amidase [Chthoniobacterales bacterium]